MSESMCKNTDENESECTDSDSESEEIEIVCSNPECSRVPERGPKWIDGRPYCLTCYDHRLANVDPGVFEDSMDSDSSGDTDSDGEAT